MVSISAALESGLLPFIAEEDGGTKCCGTEAFIPESFFVTFCTGNDGFDYRQFQRTENFSIAVIQVFGNTFVHPSGSEHMDTTQRYILMSVHVFPDGKDKRHTAPHCHSFLRDGGEYIIHIDYGPEYTGHIYGTRKVQGQGHVI